MQAEEKRETDGSSSAAPSEERPYDAFSYDVVPANLSGRSVSSKAGGGSTGSTGSSSRRVAEPTAEDYEIRAEDVKIERKLGEGYFGEVFQGTWLGQPIAAKILKASHTSEEADAEFVRETSLLNKLRHPNVILFYGVCTTPDMRRMIVSELLHSSLFTLIHSGTPVPDSLWVRIAHDIAAGLAYLHSRSPPIVHRDLSSSNVLLTADVDALVRNSSNSRYPVAKISDFGLSRAMEWYMTQRTGNMFYMAVEVFQGEHYTEKADVYSLGITMSEMFTRTRPYGGLNPHKAAFQAASIGLRPSLPSNLVPMLKNLVERCWAQDPADRPSSSDVLYILQQNVHLAEVTVAPPSDDPLESLSGEDMSMSGYEVYSVESLPPEEAALQLIHCIQDDDVDAVQRMLSSGNVDVNFRAPTEANKTALHFATSTRMARLLCDYGAQPYIADDAGDTPLHTFYRLGLSGCIQVLLTNGCREDMRNNKGQVPRECIDMSVALDRIGRSRAVDDMRWLISQEALVGADPKQQMEYLHRLAKLKAWNVFAVLLEVYREPAISFNGFDLQREGFCAIVDVLKRKRFRKIDLVNNSLLAGHDPQGLVIRKLASLLRACATSLVDLDLRENGIGDEPLLVAAIKQCSALRCLNGYRFLTHDVRSRVLSLQYVAASSTRLREQLAELQRLQARMEQISNLGRSLPHDLFLEAQESAARQQAISQEVAVERPVERKEPLVTYEAAFLVRRIAQMEGIQSLSFAKLRLPPAAVKEIAEVIVPLPIDDLSLMGCHLTDEALGYIIEALRSDNARIRGLNIGYNAELTNEALRQLLDVVRTNTSLRTLHMTFAGDHREEAELAAVVSEALVQNRSLRYISTSYHRIEPIMIRGDRGGQHVLVDCLHAAFPETYELLLPLNRVSTKFTFVHTHPAALRGIRDHPTLRTLSIETEKLDQPSFETLLEVLPTLAQLEHLNLTCGSAHRRVHCPARPGLNAEMLQRLIAAVQTGPTRLSHLVLDSSPLLHGARGEVAIGARVSVVRKVGDSASAIAEAEGTVVEMELDGANRLLRIRSDDNGQELEYRNFHVVRHDTEISEAEDGMLVLPYHQVDTRGLEALRQLAASENSPLRRVWMRRIVSYELAAPEDVVAIVVAAAEACTGCAFYVSVDQEQERIIGQRPNVGNTLNNVTVGDRIIIGTYELSDEQREEFFQEGVLSELPAPHRSPPFTVTGVDLNWDGTLRLAGRFDGYNPTENALAPAIHNGRELYPPTILCKAEVQEAQEPAEGAGAEQAAPAATAATTTAAGTALEREETKQEVPTASIPDAILVVPAAAPAPAAAAATAAGSTRRLCNAIIPPHNPFTFNIQLCHGCFLRVGSDCVRCDARIMGRGEPAWGCVQCGNMNRQKCVMCASFVGVTGKAAFVCQNCDRMSAYQKQCSWRK